MRSQCGRCEVRGARCAGARRRLSPRTVTRQALARPRRSAREARRRGSWELGVGSWELSIVRGRPSGRPRTTRALELVPQRELHTAARVAVAGRIRAIVGAERRLDVGEHVHVADIEARRVGEVERIPPEPQPLVVRPGHVPRLGDAQVDAEVAVTAEHVARPTLTRVVEPQKLKRLLGRDREGTRLAFENVLGRPCGRKLGRILERGVALQVPVGRPAGAAVVDVEREAAREPEQARDTPPADDRVD